jgi:hypothetical protein
LRREPFDFPLISFPHRYNASCTAARGPDNDHDALIEPAGADEAWLAIVAAIIDPRQVHTLEDLLDPPEIESSLMQRSRPFGRIKGDQHLFIVVTFIQECNTQGAYFCDSVILENLS